MACNINTPEYQYQVLLLELIGRFSTISNFRRYVLPQLDEMSPTITKELIDSLVYSYSRGHLTDDGKKALHELPIMSDILTKGYSLWHDDILSLINATSLLFAHSAIELFVHNGLKLISTVAPNKWEPFLPKQLMKVAYIKDHDYKDILAKCIKHYLHDLYKKPLPDKIDYLFKLCGATNDLALIGRMLLYRYDPSRVARIDNLRHTAIHEFHISSLLDNIESDIEFLLDTSLYLHAKMNDAFNLTINLQHTEDIVKTLFGGKK